MRKSRRHEGESQKTVDEDAWRVELDATSINDDRWWCIATMMVETTVGDGHHVSLLNETVEAGKRRTRVCYLSRGNATATVKTLSEEDPEKCPVAQRVCHYANTLLSESNGGLPAWLMAWVVKYLIYRAKIEHCQGTGMARAPGIDAPSQRATEGPGGTQRVGAGFGSDGKESANSRQRGAKDVPFHEPDLYVVLSGFHDPDLPAELLSAGVPLTCILQIKLPGEPVARAAQLGDSEFAKKTGLSANYRVDEDELRDFWTTTNRRFSDPWSYPAYSDIAVLAFCPPPLLPSFRAFEKRSLMRDTYDEMCRALRHLCHLHRHHADYLESMKLEKRILETRSRPIDTGIYEDTLSDIPNECIDVPLILCAMLLQVEADLAGFPGECFSAEHNAKFRLRGDMSGGDAPTGGALRNECQQVLPRDIRSKLEQLDREYELGEEHTDQPSRSSDIELILYGDALSAITRHVDHQRSLYLIDGVLRILQDPRIMNVWRDHEAPDKSETDMYSYHLDNIAELLNRKRTVSREEVAHYLHLLVFNKLILSGSKREEETRRMRNEASEARHARAATRRRRTRSAPDLTSYSTVTCSLRASRSDIAIDYGGSAVAEWSPLFALTDTRETLLPGYLYKNVSKRTSYERPTIEEYEDVELLSGRVFPQVARECFQSFDRFAARYFEPTDSVLLYFSNNNETDDDAPSEKTRSSSNIRTPVRFRDFCKYVALEEENWMKRREMRETRRSEPTGRFMKESAEVEDGAIIFDDECFVLPGSLKARRLKETRCPGVGESRDDARQGDEMTGQRRDGAPVSGAERVDARVTSGKTSMTGKKSSREINDGDTAPAEKSIPSGRYAEQEDAKEGKHHDFLGYDLGRVRVQVTHRGESYFLGDGIAVRIETDDWLYGDFHLRVAVALRDCTLRLSGGGADRHRLPGAFHLTTSRGIVLGFRRNGEPAATVEKPSSGRNLAFDFRASWPSGLLIEPTIGAGGKNPFYIRQSYVPECPARAGAAREVRRNFLRNGVVLKHLADNTVVILRPNGVIVTCTDFDETRSHESTVVRRTAGKTELTAGESSLEQFEGSDERVMDTDNEFIVDVQPSGNRMEMLAGERATVSNGDDSLITGIFGVGQVLRYSVVNYDGRCYEVLNDLLVSEHDRLLVRTVSDYEVNEIFTRRTDGTDMLFRLNGELVVTFPDGTRIITGCMVEEQLVTCEWSEDEIRNFGPAGDKEHDDVAANVASEGGAEFPYREDAPVASLIDHRGRPTRESIVTDGFVSILLTFRMEHKDYATVSYDQSAVMCTLSMPDDLCVSISGRGRYEVSMGGEVNLKIRDDDAVLSKECATCGGRSMSTFEFGESTDAAPRTILTTIDILGNLLEVKSDGATRYHRVNRERDDDVLLECGGDRRSNEEEEKEEEEDEREEEEEEQEKGEEAVEVSNSGLRFRCKHQRYCEKLEFPARSQYRIFAMNRDLTACEYLHRSVRREQEVAAVFGDGTSMIQYPISRRPELRRLITFVPVEPELGSKEISCQYWVTSDKRADYDRMELRRSTYSSPYNWLFPFGKRGRRVPPTKRTRDEVSAEQNEQPLPKLLRVRVLFGIKEADRSVLIDIPTAISRYWISVFRDSDKCRPFYVTGSRRPDKVENDYESSEEGLVRELALGLKRSIDAQTYVGGLRRKLIKVNAGGVCRQSSRLAELLQQRGSQNEEYEWYKQCMRKRIIAPYFRVVADSCRLLLKDLVDEVARLPKNHSRDIKMN